VQERGAGIPHYIYGKNGKLYMGYPIEIKIFWENLPLYGV